MSKKPVRLDVSYITVLGGEVSHIEVFFPYFPRSGEDVELLRSVVAQEVTEPFKIKYYKEVKL